MVSGLHNPSLCFTYFQAISGCPEGCTGMLQIQPPYYVLHALRRSGYSESCQQIPKNRRSYCVLHACSRYQRILMDAEGSISGYPDACRGMLLIQCLYRVLHALRRYQNTLKVAEGSYKFNVRIVFYMLAGHIRVS